MSYSKVYPQDATNALTSVLRQDEQSAVAAEQTDLAAKQKIGTIGETIPLAFARRRDDIGGVWVSPKLIQLGVRQQDINMLYVLSQGKVAEPAIDNVFYGYTAFPTITNGRICAAYEAIPPCVELDYNPGGSTSWDTTVVYSGPGMPRTGDTTEFITRTDKCTQLALSFSGSCTVSIPSGTYVVENEFLARGASAYGWANPGPGDFAYRGIIWDWQRYGIPVELVVNNTQCIGRTDTIFSRSVSATVRSEARFNYQVINTKTNAVERSGEVWVPDGGTTLTISGLPPAQYKVVFSDHYSERTSAIDSYTPRRVRNSNQYDRWYDFAPNGRDAWAYQNYVASLNGAFRRNIAGSVSESFSAAQITETVRNELHYPTVPGGSNQQSGGYTDLTLLGARGHYDALRPATGPNHFTQIHAFLFEGIKVPKLLEAKAVGASDSYPDLVYYLMNLAGMLKADQIDEPGLSAAAVFNDKYKLRFNGVLTVTVNFREWLSRTAPYFLLTPRQVDGRFGLDPVVPIDSGGAIKLTPVQAVATFGPEDIGQGSLQKTWVPASERKPFVAVMVYREQPTGSVGQSRTVEVRYSGLAADGPFEQHDMTEFCCTAEHAVYAARYILARRRYVTHSIVFQAGRKAALLTPGQIIKLTLTVATSEGDGYEEDTFYQIEQLSETGAGAIEVVANEFPVNANGVSKIAYDIAQGDVVILQ